MIVGLDGADEVRGGDGTDTLDLAGAAAGVTVFLNGLADDGAAGTAAVDVERVVGQRRSPTRSAAARASTCSRRARATT